MGARNSKDRQTSTKSSTTYTSPCSLEQLHSPVTDIQVTAFEGARLLLNRGLTQCFQTTHTLNLCSPTDKMAVLSSGGLGTEEVSYKFAATFVELPEGADELLKPRTETDQTASSSAAVGSEVEEEISPVSKPTEPLEPRTVYMADVQSSGNVSAQIVHNFSSHIRGRYIAQFAGRSLGKLLGQQAAVECKFGVRDSWLFGAVIGNPSLNLSSCLGVLELSKQLTERLMVGNQLLIQRSPSIPSGQMCRWSVAARVFSFEDVEDPPSSLTASASTSISTSSPPTSTTTSCPQWQLAVSATPLTMGLHVSMLYSLSSYLKVGLEWEHDIRSQALTTLAYQYDFLETATTFKATFNTNWMYMGMLEKKLNPSLSLALCGKGNHRNNTFSVGIGLTVG